MAGTQLLILILEGRCRWLAAWNVASWLNANVRLIYVPRLFYRSCYCVNFGLAITAALVMMAEASLFVIAFAVAS